MAPKIIVRAERPDDRQVISDIVRRAYPISLPFDAPAVNRMILPLVPHALEGVSGIVKYADGWLDH